MRDPVVANWPGTFLYGSVANTLLAKCNLLLEWCNNKCGKQTWARYLAGDAILTKIGMGHDEIGTGSILDPKCGHVLRLRKLCTIFKIKYPIFPDF